MDFFEDSLNNARNDETKRYEEYTKSFEIKELKFCTLIENLQMHLEN